MRLGIPAKKVANALLHIRERSLLVTVTVQVAEDTCPHDQDDIMFLECAESAGADYLVTGNRRHYPDEWKNTKIVTAREFMDIIINAKSGDPTEEIS